MLFTLSCILDLDILLTKGDTWRGENTRLARCLSLVSMTGDRRIAQFHASIGCSSTLFGQSVRRHSE